LFELEHWPEMQALAARLYADDVPPEIIEFSDYECPYCRHASPAVDSALSGGAKIAYLHYPLAVHIAAEGAARAAICAANAGEFRTMHARLMSTEEWRADTNWVAQAREAGVADTETFRRCLHARSTSDLVARHKRLAEAIGLAGTPTFVSPNGIRSGIASTQDIQSLRR
jgi:protein-disulfide isomerase